MEEKFPSNRNCTSFSCSLKNTMVHTAFFSFENYNLNFS